jgi:catechol 2,3-dioxygenase-like lactoylglutathione lyase family enzyme
MDTQDRPALQGSLPVRLHHRAIVTRDQEANRHFLEDILGIPLAFFQFADPEMLRLTTAEKPAEVPQFDHTAFSVDDATYDEIAARLRRAGLEFRETDHGYCRSLYVYSPDGLRLEFTVDHPKVEEIMAERRGSAHADLARWLAGDHSVNNDLRHH